MEEIKEEDFNITWKAFFTDGSETDESIELIFENIKSGKSLDKFILYRDSSPVVVQHMSSDKRLIYRRRAWGWINFGKLTPIAIYDVESLKQMGVDSNLILEEHKEKGHVWRMAEDKKNVEFFEIPDEDRKTKYFIYLVGWQTTVKGKNIQSITVLFPDGHTENIDRWRNEIQFFAEPEFKDYEVSA